jgi:hypothetical protein
LNLTDKSFQGRGQAHNETAIAQDPLQPNHIVATSNDYRRGDASCFNSYSRDGGRTWNDAVVPMSFTRGFTFGGARQYWQAGGDPSVAWDTKGNAYFTCMVFNRGSPPTTNKDLSSAVYVFRSTQNFGASWNFPGRPVVESADVAGTVTAPFAFEDKPYMTVDNHVGSFFQDRIYVTWTEFSADGSAYIWESHSADFGEHFSARVLVSVNSPLCTVTFGAGTPQGNCNENQFSQPFTGPDGTLYVVFDNYNNSLAAFPSCAGTPCDNHNQVLVAKSTNGGTSFTSLVKVADFFDLPDCLTYQGKDAFRACVPEKGSSTNSFFRAANYPSGAVNPVNPSQIVVAFASYINVDSKETNTNSCSPAGLSSTTGLNLYMGVKTAGACNNKILLSVSNDGGLTFKGTTIDPRLLPTVNTDPGQRVTDQWWQWIAFTRNGRLAVSYYDRQYGDDETTGFSDVSLSGSGDLLRFAVFRVTSESMPPPTQFAGTFFGDYTGLTAVDDAHPLWMDTRNVELFLCPQPPVPTLCTGIVFNGLEANNQDIFTSTVAVP